MTPLRQHGFSLLEVLVAFSIMAMGLGVLYKATGSSVNLTRTIEQRTYAVMMAQSLLDHQQSVPFAGWEDHGRTEDGYEWRLTSEPLPEENPVPPALHQVTLEVLWMDGEKPSSIRLLTVLPELPPPGESS